MKFHARPDEVKCFRCKGCRGLIAFVVRPTDVYAMHEKPMHLLNVPNSVSCSLFNQLDALTLWTLHQDAERLPAPSRFDPKPG